jgi:hypothetical protein
MNLPMTVIEHDGNVEGGAATSPPQRHENGSPDDHDQQGIEHAAWNIPPK